MLKIGLETDPEPLESRADFDVPGLAEARCGLLNRSLVARGIKKNLLTRDLA